MNTRKPLNLIYKMIIIITYVATLLQMRFFQKNNLPNFEHNMLFFTNQSIKCLEKKNAIFKSFFGLFQAKN